MRIVSGSHKGIKIQMPNNLGVRPTTDRAKESLFNILQNRYMFENKCVLDLFAGSGNISYEFFSRGCSHITSVDLNKKCVLFIKNQIKQLKININIVHEDATKFIRKNTEKFDFIFLDPPYIFKDYNELKELIVEKNIINEGGCLIIEHDKNTSFNDYNVELKKYGSVYFSIFSF